MNIVIFGTDGMLGHDFADLVKTVNSTQRNPRPGHEVIRVENPLQSDVDITDRAEVNRYLSTMKSRGCDTVVNCVDFGSSFNEIAQIQSHAYVERRSYKVNALAPKYLAEACESLGMRLVHVSTNHVYSDSSLDTVACHDEFPTSIYGCHKLAGELFVKSVMRSNYSIVRFGSLYGMHNPNSHIHTFLRNAANSIRIKSFKVELNTKYTLTPTSTTFASKTLLNILERNMSGTMTASPRGQANMLEVAEKLLEFMTALPKVFPDELKRLRMVEYREELDPFFPHELSMEEMNRGAHLYSDPSCTWEADLQLFVDDNRRELAKWFADLLK